MKRGVQGKPETPRSITIVGDGNVLIVAHSVGDFHADSGNTESLREVVDLLERLPPPR